MGCSCNQSMYVFHKELDPGPLIQTSSNESDGSNIMYWITINWNWKEHDMLAFSILTWRSLKNIVAPSTFFWSAGERRREAYLPPPLLPSVSCISSPDSVPSVFYSLRWREGRTNWFGLWSSRRTSTRRYSRPSTQLRFWTCWDFPSASSCPLSLSLSTSPAQPLVASAYRSSCPAFPSPPSSWVSSSIPSCRHTSTLLL